MKFEIKDRKQDEIEVGDLIQTDNSVPRLVIRDGGKYALLDIKDCYICSYWYGSIQDMMSKLHKSYTIISKAKNLKLIGQEND